MSDCKKNCKGCPSLKLVEEPKNLEEVPERSFWNSCPRNLEQLPQEPCHMGKPERNSKGRIVKEPECPWWIDSVEHNYCFWAYVRANSTPDGKMDPMMQNEIAKMLGCSSTKIHFILKEAIAKIKNGPYAYILEDFDPGMDLKEGDPEHSLGSLESAVSDTSDPDDE